VSLAASCATSSVFLVAAAVVMVLSLPFSIELVKVYCTAA
jgi:hypothetical protein